MSLPRTSFFPSCYVFSYCLVTLINVSARYEPHKTISNSQYYPHFTNEQRFQEVKKCAQSHTVHPRSQRIYKQICLTHKLIDVVASSIVFILDLLKTMLHLPYSIVPASAIAKACIEMRPLLSLDCRTTFSNDGQIV